LANESAEKPNRINENARTPTNTTTNLLLMVFLL
jgi:hypothetical protein